MRILIIQSDRKRETQQLFFIKKQKKFPSKQLKRYVLDLEGVFVFIKFLKR